MAFHFRCTGRGVGARGLLLSALLVCGPARAERGNADLSAGPAGKIIDLPSGRGEGELLRLDAAARSGAPRPEAGGRRRPFRTGPCARGAPLLPSRSPRGLGRGREGLPRGRRGPDGDPALVARLLLGRRHGRRGARAVVVPWTPRRARSRRSSTGPTACTSSRRDASDAAGRHLLAAPVRPDGVTARCAQEDFPDTASLPSSVAGRAAEGRTAAVLGSLYKGILAIDTDKEYLASFGEQHDERRRTTSRRSSRTSTSCTSGT